MIKRTLSVIMLVAAGGTLPSAALPSAALAQTEKPGYSIEDVTACSPDAMRLCRDKIPDLDAIQDCMKAHYADLRASCKARFDVSR